MENSEKNPSSAELERLKAYFGFESFRSHQYEAISDLKSGKNVFFKKPTGGGKSLIYQFLALNYKIVVLSPLIALMDDQVYQARKHKINAFCLHSQQSSSERARALKNWLESHSGLLFVTPERFAKVDFVEEIKKQKIDFFVVDEAHCASEWGHDFRPDYSKIGEIKKLLGDPVSFSCTATATKTTTENIIEKLGVQNNVVIYEDNPVRENLNFTVEEGIDFKDKQEQIFELFKKIQGSTIIYFTLIKNLEDFASRLPFDFVKYHSKIPSNLRRKNQQQFIEGESQLMLATPAFGLGVNKADIRNIIQFDLPDSVEAFVQEVGRAGRDGLDSYCYLFYSQEDLQVQMDFIKWGYPEPEVYRWLYERIRERKDIGFPLKDLDELKRKLNFYNSYDFRLESVVNVLLRWEVLINENGILKIGSENLSVVPDLDDKQNKLFINNKQKKLYELLQLVKIKEKEGFNDYINNYFEA